jgi:hypothetical protein
MASQYLSCLQQQMVSGIGLGRFCWQHVTMTLASTSAANRRTLAERQNALVFVASGH